MQLHFVFGKPFRNFGPLMIINFRLCFCFFYFFISGVTNVYFGNKMNVIRVMFMPDIYDEYIYNYWNTAIAAGSFRANGIISPVVSTSVST